MAGKITTILAKREAETYCIQGLHKEALQIYRKLLNTSPNIDPSFKAGIEDQINKISAELESDDIIEANRLTAADIVRVQKGWGEDATESDMLICAQAFYQIGYYKEALHELTGILRKGCAIEKISTLLAGCLVHMCRPSQTAGVLEKLYRDNLNHPEDQFHLSMMLAEEMVALKQPHHAKTMVRYLQQHSEAGETDAQRMAAIVDSLEHPDQGQTDTDPNHQGVDSEKLSPTDQINQDAGSDPSSIPKESPPKKNRWFSFFRKRS